MSYIDIHQHLQTDTVEWPGVTERWTNLPTVILAAQDLMPGFSRLSLVL